MAKCAAMWIQFDTIISCLCLILFLPKTNTAYNILCYCCKILSRKCMEKYVKYSTFAQVDQEKQEPQLIIN